MYLKKIFGFLFLTVFAAVAGAQDISRDSGNVEKLYKAVVAQQVLPVFGSDWNESAKIEVRDTKNGYLKITGAIDGWLEVALFRKTNRKPLLVIGVTGCGPACGTELHAFEFRSRKAVNVSKKVFPKFKENEVDNKLARRFGKKEDYYGDVLDVLPRKGKTIKTVFESEDDVLYRMEWKNDRFEIKRNVSDLYSILPGNVLSSDRATEAKVLIEDIKNGYLKLKLRSSTIEVALFRAANGTPFLFTVENYCGTGRCATAEYDVSKYVGEKWINVTETIMPEISEKRIHAKSSFAAKHGYQYKLPRKGRSVRIVEGSDGKTIYRLDWKKNKFEIR